NGAVDPAGASVTQRGTAALAAASMVLAARGGALLAVASSRRRSGVGGSAGQQRHRKLEQPTPDLLLPAAAVGSGLPGVVAVLSESPAVSTEGTSRAWWPH